MVRFTSNCDYASLTVSLILLLICIAGAVYGIVTKNTAGTGNCVFFGVMAYAFVHVLWKEATAKKGGQDE